MLGSYHLDFVQWVLLIYPSSSKRLFSLPERLQKGQAQNSTYFTHRNVPLPLVRRYTHRNLLNHFPCRIRNQFGFYRLFVFFLSDFVFLSDFFNFVLVPSYFIFVIPSITIFYVNSLVFCFVSLFFFLLGGEICRLFGHVVVNFFLDPIR